MVVVDQTSHSKHALMWALTHVANKGDMLTLLHIVPPYKGFDSRSTYLVNYLGSLCKDCNPGVEVEGLVIEGPKLATVMSQVKKLEVSVLVLGQKKTSPLIKCLCGSNSTEEFVEQCINIVECLTIGVRKRSQGNNGYLISTRWQKNFWLLA
ncbi:Adenine nucleotide alpha hydrolases-like superfamily protein [Quillaja saponaria]|uniref:Adenine nucleotide alpha hydrolases-like superfamily protein n=1 Tax=Quillaja saponaria TaxID=32244 RepID=A0AAD7PSK2_QUISA|nr:Adenine nucleotide alpha hydrolases-like superfamily protein [Quillaja saponaria]